MSKTLTKYSSIDLRRKINSSTKLPRLPSVQIGNKKNESIIDFNKDNIIKKQSTQKISLLGQKRSKSTDRNKNILKQKLQPIKPQKSTKYIKQQTNQAISIRRTHKIQRKYSPKKDKIQQEEIKQTIKLKKAFQQSKIDIKIQKQQQPIRRIKQTVVNSQTRSNGSSRQIINPILQKIHHILSPQIHQQIVYTRILNQKVLGQLSGIWWSVIDSLFVSLQKLIKVKRTYQQISQKDKKQRNTKSLSGQKGIRLSGKIRQSMGIRQSSTVKREQNRKLTGKTLTKVKTSIQITKLVLNEKVILKYYDDPNHISLILQGFFYEKVIIYMIGSVRKWNHSQQQFQIHNLSIRKLIIDILIQELENDFDGKIRKPKYISKQKKLIQISKYTTIMKIQLQKTLQNLGSPHRYKIFEYSLLNQHNNLYKLQCKWKQKIFDFPIPPFIKKRQKNKSYLLIIQPLNILYRYNKKQQTLLIDPQVQNFLSQISKHYQIIFFTHVDKQISLLNFIGVLQKLQIQGILDKSHISFRQGKPIKDLNKIGTSYDVKNMVVLDDKINHKYYYNCQQSLFLVQGNHSHMKICKIRGKVFRKQQNDQDFLNDIANQLIKYAQTGIHWFKKKIS